MSLVTDRSADLGARTTGTSADTLWGVPVILAGSLDADNVAAAIAAVRPAGVDSKTKTRPCRRQRQRPRRGAALLYRCEAHQVKAVARSSTAPLFCITPNSCHRHCDPGAQPRRRSLSALAANCGSRMTGLPLSVGCGKGAHTCCAMAGTVANATTRAAARAPYCIACQSAFSIASALDTSNTPGSSTCSALTTPLSTSIE
jgi:hypothetical protein